MRFRTSVAIATSVACRPLAREHSPSPMTRFHREMSDPTPADMGREAWLLSGGDNAEVVYGRRR
jgi:hypothetical protein